MSNSIIQPFFLLVIVVLNWGALAAPAWADITLPSLLSAHALLQRSDHTQVWGKADAGEKVKISLGGIEVRTVAGADGKWKVSLDVTRLGEGPHSMVIEGNNRLVVSDVLIGEVWVCCGQSNMAFPLIRSGEASEEILRAANTKLRQFRVENAASATPQDDCKGTWVVASPETAGQFSAVGYFFGKSLQQKLNQPVGLVLSAWPGSSVDAWLPQGAIDESPEWKDKQANAEKFADAYPALKDRYLSSFHQWESQFTRTDHPADPDLYAAANASVNDWKIVTLPSSLPDAGLCDSGAVWFRRKFTIPQCSVLKNAMISIGSPRDFNELYINGKKIGETNVESMKSGHEIRYNIPNGTLAEGENTFAIRLFTPSEKAAISSSLFLQLGAVRHLLNGEWLAKVEFALPALTDSARKALPKLQAPPEPYQISGRIFNGMIHPLMAATIQGVVWYQGEQDSREPAGYWQKFGSLIQNWRKAWGTDFPFNFCQLPNYGPKQDAPENSLWAQLREAQSKALALVNTGQAILIDCGEEDIHPIYKQKVGERLARIALARTYKQNVTDLGPIFKSMEIEGDKIRLSFLPGEGGLVAKPLPAEYQPTNMSPKLKPLVRRSPEGELEGFAICGENKKWVWATAKIAGNTVLVWSRDVPRPVAVRYAWSDNPTCNLYNKADLPAAPFQVGN